MSGNLASLWVYLSASPLLHLTLTLAAFLVGDHASRRLGRPAWANPVLIAVALLVAILVVTQTSYARYFEGAQFVHFLLGPATVALALPLHRQVSRIRRAALPLLAALLTGSLTAAAAAIAVGVALQASPAVTASLAPKSVTTPVAMAIAERLGGLPSFTAILVIATGIIGAALGPALLDRLGVRQPAARGLALGTGAHGIGTARALQESEVAGAFSGLAMGLNALASALLVPLLWALMT